MTGEIWTLLGINLALTLGTLTLVAIPSFRSKDPSYIDGVWGLSFVLVALASFVQTSGDDTRRYWLVGLCLLWGLRLSGYLLRRWARSGPDHRYQAMLAKKKKGSDAFFLWTRVFVTQGLILSVVSLPVQLGQVYDHPVGLAWWNVIGNVLAAFGIVFESIGDFQLNRFRLDPANKGLVMDRGLWGYTRHPNYFGETCVWWGLFLVCLVNVPTAFAAIGPLLITGFLLKWSGVGHLEKSLKKSKPKYADYIKRTSPFFPLPKRS